MGEEGGRPREPQSYGEMAISIIGKAEERREARWVLPGKMFRVDFVPIALLPSAISLQD